MNKQFNKKKLLMLLVLPLFCLVLVNAALLTFYGQIHQDIEVNQPIDFTGTKELINCNAGETCYGKGMTVGNDGNNEVDILIDNNAPEGIDVSYVGTLELTKKTVDFNLDVWEVLEDKVQIEYTIVGDTFEAEVTEGAIEGYELIYYADNADRFNNVAKAVNVDDVDASLPYSGDQNAEDGTYDYCSTLEYVTCHGAKIWYVPGDAIDNDGNIAWGQASEFYFESSLIQYNVDGDITVYPNEVLDFTPEYTLDLLLSEGTYWVTTKVLPAI